MSFQAFESAYMKLYGNQAGGFLTPFWNIVMQEGIRGNHLLFSKSPEALEEISSYELVKHGSFLQTAVDKLLKMNGCSEMCEWVSRLTTDQRAVLFSAYLHALRAWKERIKSDSH